MTITTAAWGQVRRDLDLAKQGLEGLPRCDRWKRKSRFAPRCLKRTQGDRIPEKSVFGRFGRRPRLWLGHERRKKGGQGAARWGPGVSVCRSGPGRQPKKGEGRGGARAWAAGKMGRELGWQAAAATGLSCFFISFSSKHFPNRILNAIKF